MCTIRFWRSWPRSRRGCFRSMIEDSEYWRAIPLALQQGYIVNADEGFIVGPSGKRLCVRRYGTQDYPTVRLHVKGLPKSAYSVAAHKVVAFVLWGSEAFKEGVEVRHLDRNTENIKANNLVLGTSSQNQLDKPVEVRRAAAQAARRAQGPIPVNAILSVESARLICAHLAVNTNTNGRVRRGVVTMLAQQYGVSKSTISLIGKGKSWSAAIK